MLPFPDIETIAEPPTPVVEPATPWGWWVAAGVAAVILLGLGIWLAVMLWRRAAIPAAPARPEKRALRELKALRKSAGAMAPAEFGAALSGVVRSFLNRRLGLLANVSTTQELLGRAASSHEAPPPPLAQVFSHVLDACDALKFGATTQPDRAALIAETEAAMHTVQRALSSPPPAPSPPPAAAELSPPSASA
jgi:Domain of unknown function (DUF4381)